MEWVLLFFFPLLATGVIVGNEPINRFLDGCVHDTIVNVKSHNALLFSIIQHTLIEWSKLEVGKIFHQFGVAGSLLELTVCAAGVELEKKKQIRTCLEHARDKLSS